MAGGGDYFTLFHSNGVHRLLAGKILARKIPWKQFSKNSRENPERKISLVAAEKFRKKNKFSHSLSQKYSPQKFLKQNNYFFIKSRTALVMALTPVRMVGAGTGANSLECGPGRRVPFS